jgi:hypothetical protein
MFRDLVRPFLESGIAHGEILEAGCGTGNVAFEIAGLFPDAKVTAIDITEKSLEIANRKLTGGHIPNLEFRRSDLMEYDPELGNFDFIHCQGVLHHLSSPLKGLQNLYMYLKPGGYAYVWLYMLLGRRFILDIREIMDIFKDQVISDNDRLGLLKLILEAGGRQNRSEGLKRHAPDNQTPLKTGFMERLIFYMRLAGNKGISGTVRAIVKKITGGGKSGNSIPGQTELAAIESGLVDMYLHPHDIFFRMHEVLQMIGESGFLLHKISDGMSVDLKNCLGDGELLDIALKLPASEQLRLIEVLEKPSGVGFFLRKAETS